MSVVAKIAVLDDSDTYRAFISAVINTQPDLQAVAVGDDDALESVLFENDIRCVLLDYHLRDGTGLDARARLSRKLAGRRAFPPTILMTGDTDARIPGEAKAVGVTLSFRKHAVRPRQIIDILGIVTKTRTGPAGVTLQQRTDVRSPASLGGRLVIGDRVVPCTVKNLSASGAGLRLHDYIRLPATFGVIHAEETAARRVSLRWQLGNDCGVAYRED